MEFLSKIILFPIKRQIEKRERETETVRNSLRQAETDRQRQTHRDRHTETHTDQD